MRRELELKVELSKSDVERLRGELPAGELGIGPPRPARFIGSKGHDGTELKIITPAATEVLGPEVDRLATLHTNARTDTELLKFG